MAIEKRLIDANEFHAYLEDVRQIYLEEDTFSSNFAAEVIETVQDEYLAKAPTVDAAEVVHGRWREKMLVGGFAEEWGFVCSECGCTVSDRSNLGIGRYASNNQRLNYCPNCGAKMDGGRE